MKIITKAQIDQNIRLKRKISLTKSIVMLNNDKIMLEKILSSYSILTTTSYQNYHLLIDEINAKIDAKTKELQLLNVYSEYRNKGGILPENSMFLNLKTN